MKTDLFENGLYFTSPIAQNFQDVFDRAMRGFACAILIDGQPAQGKTTLAVEGLEFLQKKPIDYKVQLAMGGEEFRKKLVESYEKGYHVVIYDEAGDLNRRGALTKFNRELIDVFRKFRTFKVLVFIVLQNFSVLDKDLFIDGTPRLLINCHNRDVEGLGCVRGYDIEGMFYLMKHMKDEVVPMRAYQKQTPNFRGWFKNLDSGNAKILDKMSTAEKHQSIKLNGLYSTDDIARRTGRTTRWVRAKIKEFGIEASTRHMRKHYYDAVALDLIKGTRKG